MHTPAAPARTRRAARRRRLVDSDRRFVLARLEALHAVEREAFCAAPTVRPAPPANDAEPTLAEQLEASIAIAAAAERIEVIETCYAYGKCACDEPLIAREVECAEVYRVTTAIPYRAQTLCSLSCAAYALLWDLHPTQDQSDETRDRTIALIERSFARAERVVEQLRVVAKESA